LGVEPVTLQLAAQCVNQLRHRVFCAKIIIFINYTLNYLFSPPTTFQVLPFFSDFDTFFNITRFLLQTELVDEEPILLGTVA
jgi:hypothetical protein